jgi:hypothetical protein
MVNSGDSDENGRELEPDDLRAIAFPGWLITLRL